MSNKCNFLKGSVSAVPCFSPLTTNCAYFTLLPTISCLAGFLPSGQSLVSLEDAEKINLEERIHQSEHLVTFVLFFHHQ